VEGVTEPSALPSSNLKLLLTSTTELIPLRISYKGLVMPHQNLYPEFIFAVAIWLIAISIFVFMLFAAFASLLSKFRSEIKSRLESQFSSAAAIVTNFFPKKKTKIENHPDVS
jgi:hypothetical protein